MTEHVRLIQTNAAWRQLHRDTERGTVSHAYLILSEDALTAETLCALFIDRLYRGEGRYVERVLTGRIADVTVLPGEGDKIKTEDIAGLTRTALLTPMEFEKKCYVLRAAESMTEAAQNKLLKLLEEPPSGVILLLLCANENAMLPTVRSRCRRVEVRPFSEEEIFRELQQTAAGNEGQSMVAAALSNGYIGRAKAFMQDENVYKRFVAVADAAVALRSSREILAVSTRLSALKADSLQIIDLFELLFGDCLLYNEGAKHAIRLKTEHARIAAVSAAGYTTGALIAIRPHLMHAKERARFNGNALSILEELLFAIVEEKAKCRLL